MSTPSRATVARVRRRGERGSMAVEVVLLIPVLFLFVLLIVMLGRYVAVRGDVDATARDAARAASLEPSRQAADAAARSIVNASLDSETTCGPGGIDVQLDWRPEGQVTVELNCTVSFEGLGLIGVPGTVGVGGSSSIPLDPYRSYS
ncbi:TadE family protein [Nocardioides sp. C4-1]|uniref:TadE/TadG family type IV pilus assembly protein n=1 Tax=Nocardioides sp. C4-1 TaxID=3151851 RepID=UPI0032676387